MGTYKNIDEFIEEAFPQESEIIIKRKKSKIQESLERLDSGFDDALKEIIEGADETEAPVSPDEEKAGI